MRCAIDTNLLVSATFSQITPPALVLAAWRMNRIDWVSCEFQLNDVTNTLFKPNLLAKSPGGLAMAKMLLGQIRANCVVVKLSEPLPKVCRDPNDDFLFALLEQGHADAIISGDKDVLALKGRYPVLTPRELIDRL